MGNPIPLQVRSVDPYSSYNSNNVNMLTRIVSMGVDGILYENQINIISDATSVSSVIATTGGCVKDDVYIELIANTTLDFTDVDFYYDSECTPWSETGYYYVTLRYVYEKVNPVPTSQFQIFLPSERGDYDSDTNLFLACVNVIDSTSGYRIDSIIDADPENPDNKRVTIGGVGDVDYTIEWIYESTTKTLSSSNRYVWATGTITLTLPDIEDCEAPLIIVNGGTGIVTINANAGESIERGNGLDTVTSVTLTDRYTYIQLTPHYSLSLSSKIWLNPFSGLSSVQTQINEMIRGIGGNGLQEITENYEAVAGDRLLLNTATISAFEVTLPADPTDGDVIWLQDHVGNCATANVTINRNTKNIMGLAEDMLFDQDNDGAYLVYTGATIGWYII